MSHAAGGGGGAGSAMYPRGNSRSATATPTGSPKRRLPQIPGQGPPPQQNRSRQSTLQRADTATAAVTGGTTGGSLSRQAQAGVAPLHHTSFDGGLNGRGQSLHPSNRSQSMGMGYSSYGAGGGYSDTEVMAAASTGRYYDGRGGGAVPQDPYYENTMGRGGVGAGGMQPQPPSAGGAGMGFPVDDRRAQPPPPPPRNVNFEGDPPIRGGGGPRGAPYDSDMISVTSALSSHSAPHQRPRRPG